METIKLKYSFITVIEYDQETQTLFLTIKSGKQYKYNNFPKSDWNKLQQAHNKGSYIANNILTGPKAYQGIFVSQKEINHNANFQKFLAL